MNKINLQKIVEDCKACNKQLTVSEATDIFISSYSMLYNEGSVLKDIEKKLGDNEYNLLITSMMSTFLTNLFVNKAFDDINDAIQYGASVGANKAAVMKGENK